MVSVNGSGGNRETAKSLRHVAFGLATFSLHPLSDTSSGFQRVGFLESQVPGRQTVPGADLCGAIQILSRVSETNDIQIPIDAKYVDSWCHTLLLERVPHGDLRSILLQLIDGRSGTTEINKVKSLGRQWPYSHQAKQNCFAPHASELIGGRCGRGSCETIAARHESGTEGPESGAIGAGSSASRHLGQTRQGGRHLRAQPL